MLLTFVRFLNLQDERLGKVSLKWNSILRKVDPRNRVECPDSILLSALHQEPPGRLRDYKNQNEVADGAYDSHGQIESVPVSGDELKVETRDCERNSIERIEEGTDTGLVRRVDEREQPTVANISFELCEAHHCKHGQPDPEVGYQKHYPLCNKMNCAKEVKGSTTAIFVRHLP